MPTDTRIALPSPNYKVEQVVVGRKHLYAVTREANGVVEPLANLPGVTGVLGIIAKPQLVPWATNQGISSVVASLVCGLDDLSKIGAKAQEVAEAIKAAKKSKKFVESMRDFLIANFAWKRGLKIPLTPQDVAEMMDRAIRAPDEIKEAAADLGTQAHAYFEAYCKGEAPAPSTLPAPLQPPAQRFLKWVEESGLAIVAGDTKVASLKHGFGGALDAILCVVDETKTPKHMNLGNGDFVLGDYKSSNGIYDEYALQVAAYNQAFEETYGLTCQGCTVIRFGKDLKKDKNGQLLPLDFEQKWVKNPARSFGAFLRAKELQADMADEHFLGDEA